MFSLRWIIMRQGRFGKGGDSIFDGVRVISREVIIGEEGRVREDVFEV